ncbi:MAG TPA: carboxypeptidase-like regulatory domain-containing protein, partial [Bacteroidales bacterium]|nr:carboxypeptidase-like regulatory domain-containing protein [Bacteroidales bacterium]
MFQKPLCILLFFTLSFSAVAQVDDILNKHVTISAKNKPIKEILLQISEKEDIGFTYSDDILRSLPLKSIQAKDKPVKEVLNELFSGMKLTYKVVGKQIVILVLAAPPRKVTISGYIKEQGSSETLIGVNVYVPSLKIGTVSNTYGFYSLTMPLNDTLTVVYSFVGYKSVEKQITSTVQELNISLEPGTILNEVVVNADAISRSSESVQMSNISVPVAQIKSIPSLLGEKDVFKVLQLMPGVQKGMEGSSGIYVRGGGPDQNLIILDDAVVYNASHLFGFFSLFNGDALKSVELTKGGFPARYGGRLSSVIDMNMKEGNKEAWHGEGGIGLISSRLTVEGPLKKNKSSILLSGRRTYLDFVSRPLTKKYGDGSYGYYFYDMNAKINYDFGRKNKLYLSGYFGKDLFSMKNKDNSVDEKAGFNWGNTTATLRWNHLFNEKLFSNASLVFSDYNFQITDKYKNIQGSKDYYAEYNSGIKDYTVKYDLDFIPNPKHWIKTGVTAIQHEFKPHAFVEVNKGSNVSIHDYQSIKGLETAIYMEDTYQPIDVVKINAGLRSSMFFSEKKQYNFLEPRLSIAYRANSDLAFKASYASMNQYIHMLSNTGISLPTDLWVPSNKSVHPQHSSQIAIGVAKDINKPFLSISLEGYYKKMDHIIGYKEGASYIDIDEVNSASESNWIENITSGQGWSYGMELFVQKKTGRFNGWVGYTLSWTQLQFDSINFGRKYYARYDRRHDISLVGIYKVSDRISISATWIYGTGNALSLPMSQYLTYTHKPVEIGNEYYGENNFPGNLKYNDENQNIENKNNFRMGPYHRLDFGIQFHKPKRWGERIWEISIYNVYNRKNPFFYYNYTDSKNVGKLKQVS